LTCQFRVRLLQKMLTLYLAFRFGLALSHAYYCWAQWSFSWSSINVDQIMIKQLILVTTICSNFYGALSLCVFSWVYSIGVGRFMKKLVHSQQMQWKSV